MSGSVLKILLNYLSFDEYTKLLTPASNVIIPDSLTNAILYIDAFIKGLDDIFKKYPELQSYTVSKIMPISDVVILLSTG